MADTLSSLKTQLQQLKELSDAGVLPQSQFDEGKAVLERRVLELVLNGPALAEPQTPPPAIAPQGPSVRLLLALGAGIVVIAAAGYWWKGAPGLAGNSTPQVATEGEPASATAPHTTNFDQIAAMTDKLAARMKEQPDDAEGWAMLARSYSVLGRHPEALQAYEKAVGLRKDDPMLLADYADSLAVKNNGKLDGEPIKQVERALKLDPRNLKALSLAGTHAFNRKDYKAAVKYWELVVQTGPADNSFVQQVEPGLAEARQLAGLPAVENSGALRVTQPVGGQATSVSGTVTLSPALRKLTQPDDTVFVFARAAQGGRMPLAILRKQVKDLPFEFTLDDSMAMSPANALSGAPRVIVGARVSKSGNAMPQPGDLTGQTEDVALGASAIKLDIKDVVKP